MWGQVFSGVVGAASGGGGGGSMQGQSSSQTGSTSGTGGITLGDFFPGGSNSSNDQNIYLIGGVLFVALVTVIVMGRK